MPAGCPTNKSVGLTVEPVVDKLTDMSVTNHIDTSKRSKHAASSDKANQRRHDRRAELLEAAADIFVEKGFHGAKVSDIVNAAGVAQGTFYLYFKNKADVLEELVGGCCKRIVGKLNSAREAGAKVSSIEELRERNTVYLIAVFESLNTERQVAKLILYRPDGAGDTIDRALDNLKRVMVEDVKKGLEEDICSGYVRTLNTKIVAELIVGMIYHIAIERFVLGRGLETDIRKLAKEIVDFELVGIADK